MAVTNEQINTWLQTNAGASDAEIAAAMGQYGVTPAQMAQATGLGQDVVQSRYDAATAPAFTLGQATMPGVEERIVDMGEGTRSEFFVKGTNTPVDAPTYFEDYFQGPLTESSAPALVANNITIYDDAQQGEHVYTPDGKYLGFVNAPRDSSFFGGVKEIAKETAPIWSAALGYVPAAAPYVAAANAIKAVNEGNLGAAIVSGLTATQGFGSDLGLSPSTMETLKQAKTATQVVNALESENPFAVINALSQTDTGKTLLNSDMGNGVTLGKVLDTANVAAAAKSGDPFRIASAIGRVGQAERATGDVGGITNRVVDDAIPQGDITKQLTDAGLDEVNLPTGIQTASLDGETPFRAEMGASPIFAEDPRAENIRPPAGYRVLSRSEQDERLVSQGSGDLPSKYETVRPVGSYYDRTLNAWLAPSGAFEAATNVEDFSKYFGSPNLSDADVEDIYRGVQAGDVTADDLYWLTGESGRPLSSDEIQRIVSDISKSGKPPADYVGEIVTTAKRPVVEPAYEEQAEPEDAPVETEYPEMVVTAPRDPAIPETPATPAVPSAPTPPATPAVPTTPTTPAQVAQVKKQLALTLNLPVSSPIVQDVIEALYGTMEYVDVSEEFEPSKRKVAPAATQKQLQQTKMAQGGYLDNLLAENMSVDDLLKLLR